MGLIRNAVCNRDEMQCVLGLKIIVSKSADLRKWTGGQFQSITNTLDHSTQQAYNGIASNNNAIVPPA